MRPSPQKDDVTNDALRLFSPGATFLTTHDDSIALREIFTPPETKNGPPETLLLKED